MALSSPLRILVLVVSLTLTGAVNAQIGGSITVYVNRADLQENGSFRRWAREFEALHPGAKVTVVAVPNYEVAMVSRFEARDYGDVMMVPRDMPRATYPNFFLPLNDLGLADDLYFADTWSHGEHHYAYSQGVSPEGLVYNKAVFKTLGLEPPQTLDELLSAAETIKASGRIPLALNVGAGWPLQQWDKAVMIFADDGRYYDSMTTDLAPFARGKPYRQSLAVAKHLFEQGYSEPDFILDSWEQSKQAFAQGRIAMYFLGSWVIPQLVSEGIPSADIGFIPFPLTNSNEAVGILNYDWGIAVARNSRNPATAKAWVRFLLTRSDFADVAGFMSTVKTRTSSTPQLTEYMSTQPRMIQAQPQSTEFIRLANKAGLDFMSGSYIRDILISPDFEGSMDYWNRRWRQAQEK
ncbi:ABC transporter substrate-binding protein [Marinimicrobium sp. ABcell2]|uniref:ABC transporter substrate-binding protein n=1 Tax=Marinimicrobium sp. ABcell2 TaxID=3069751 RepID=UPI0027AF3451|nr:ABC transporter substrate-binding protein [Marinimicrobium sp. ABcell2]MDQ2077913.1 ABC transporter substrate-binding protein [Marinimicrobium sp. ABcell2]